MSGSASITVRHRGGGKRYVVRYRLGGRGFPVLHGGSFATMKEARLRRDFIAGELAAGRNPCHALEALTAEKAPSRSYADWHDAFVESRVDVKEGTLTGYRRHKPRLAKAIGDRDPFELSPSDCQKIVAELSADMTAGSVEKWFTTVRLVLDFAGVEPNPARDRKVKLPRYERVEPDPPTARQYLAILDAMTPHRNRLPVVLLEQTGMAIGEMLALTWGNVDIAGLQFRLPRANVKAGIRARARWVQVPAWLMPFIDELCPHEDRTPGPARVPGPDRGHGA